MKISFSFDHAEIDETPVAVDRWYDRSERAWILRFVNAAGEQVGSAEWCGNGRKAADKIEATMKDLLASGKAANCWLTKRPRN